MESSYLHIGKASDLKNPKDRKIYRFLEMLPGLLSWGTLIGAVIASWLAPIWASLFIMCFVVYFVLRMFYFLFLLWVGYRKMRKEEKKNWTKELDSISSFSVPVSSWHELWHLVVIPSYGEPIEILRATFLSLEKTYGQKDKMIVVFGIEEREGEIARAKAKRIQEEFGNSFFRFFVTSHPGNIDGEIGGKGSNETWAVRAVKREIIDPLGIPYENIVVSSLDADTVVLPQYFLCISWHYLSSLYPLRTSFQPIPLYLNNIWEAPPISRILAFSSTFWHTMNQQRQEKLVTFSSHAMPFRSLVDVGFKATNVVSDDSHIFWQCFFYYKGDYRVQSLYFSVSMDANAAPRFITTVKNIYKQYRRWAYGSGEVAYAFFGFLKEKQIPLRRKFVLGFELLEAHWSWATAPILLFMLGHLPTFIGGQEFSRTLLSYNLPKFTSDILTFSMIGVILSGIVSILFLPKNKRPAGLFAMLWIVAQWLIVPFVLIVFMAGPSLEAQTRWMFGKYLGFWVTPKHRG